MLTVLETIRTMHLENNSLPAGLDCQQDKLQLAEERRLHAALQEAGITAMFQAMRIFLQITKMGVDYMITSKLCNYDPQSGTLLNTKIIAHTRKLEYNTPAMIADEFQEDANVFVIFE